MDDERDFRVSIGKEPPTDSPGSSAVIQRGSCPGGRGVPQGVSDDDD